MYLWLRLVIYVLKLPFLARLKPPFEVSKLFFRVSPLDLDVNGHMNNGRYLTLMDIGRTDLMIRGGLFGKVMRNGWMPVLSTAKIVFRRELRLFAKFRLESRIVTWDGTIFVMEHRFVTDAPGGERIAAVALVRGGLYDRKERRFVTVPEIMALVGLSVEAPEASEEVMAFLNAGDKLRALT
jgi:acyl-CoA thioesterase FadM